MLMSRCIVRSSVQTELSQARCCVLLAEQKKLKVRLCTSATTLSSVLLTLTSDEPSDLKPALPTTVRRESPGGTEQGSVVTPSGCEKLTAEQLNTDQHDFTPTGGEGGV